MRRKIVNSLITATVIGSMLTGMAVPCFAGGKKDGGSSITVLVESGSPAEALANNTAADFEKETGCKVVVDAVAYTGMYDKLSTEIKAGQAAHDVACMDFVWLAAFADAIEPITDADTSDFLPTLEESGTVDGNLLGYPMWVNAKILIYRKDLIPEDKVPKTWDEFFALGDKVKDIDGRALFTYQGIYPGYMEEMLWPAIANECGEEALTKIANYEEGSFNNEGVLKALSHIKEIADKGYLLEGTVGMNHTESQTEMMLGKAAFITNGTWMENEMQDAPREDGFEFAMATIPTENADDVHYVFDSCEQFSIPAAAKNPELAKEFLRFLYSDESVSAFAEASGALYATKSAREVAKDKLSTAIYNMYGIYEEANASSLIMSFAAVPADCKVNPKDEIFNPITSVMNDEMTVEEWAQNVEDAFAQVRADMEAAN